MDCNKNWQGCSQEACHHCIREFLWIFDLFLSYGQFSGKKIAFFDIFRSANFEALYLRCLIRYHKKALIQRRQAFLGHVCQSAFIFVCKLQRNRIFMNFVVPRWPPFPWKPNGTDFLKVHHFSHYSRTLHTSSITKFVPFYYEN